ncbi:MAG: GNAT family N-acetyltransferase [Pseudomonadota bacterium]
MSASASLACNSAFRIGVGERTFATDQTSLDALERTYQAHRAVPLPVTSTQPEPVEFEVISSVEAFYDLASDWDELFERCGRPEQLFQKSGWCQAWVETYLHAEHEAAKSARRMPDTSLFIVTARRAGRLVMLWPMARSRVSGLWQLGWLGMPMTQYGDALLDTENSGEEILLNAWSFILANANVSYLHLSNIRATATVAPLLETVGAVKTVVRSAPFMRFKPDVGYDEYMSRFSSRSRKTRRRKQRKLETLGTVTFQEVQPGDTARKAVEDALNAKRKWLHNTGRVGSAIMDTRVDRFFQRIADPDIANRIGTRITEVRVDDTLAASDICFVSDGHLMMHFCVFNNAYEKMSVGQLLLDYSVRIGLEENLTTYDFLAPADQYKLDWADDATDVVDWAYPLNVMGWIWVRGYLGFARERLKSLQAKMPVRIRQTLVALQRRLSGFTE